MLVAIGALYVNYPAAGYPVSASGYRAREPVVWPSAGSSRRVRAAFAFEQSVRARRPPELPRR
jgi:hypothetical protein